MDWSACKAKAEQVDRSVHFVEYFCATGLFERSHFLMGMEEAFCAYLEEPEAMFEMLSAIAEYKKALVKEAAYHLRPTSVSPGRLGLQAEPVSTPRRVARDDQAALHRHSQDHPRVRHALRPPRDCVCDPIVEDMVEIGIDIWQGVIPENDIVDIHRRTQGRLPMIGGIDGPAIDDEDTPDEAIVAEVHRCIDTYCRSGASSRRRRRTFCGSATRTW